MNGVNACSCTSFAVPSPHGHAAEDLSADRTCFNPLRECGSSAKFYITATKKELRSAGWETGITFTVRDLDAQADCSGRLIQAQLN